MSGACTSCGRSLVLSQVRSYLNLLYPDGATWVHGVFELAHVEVDAAVVVVDDLALLQQVEDALGGVVDVAGEGLEVHVDLALEVVLDVDVSVRALEQERVLVGIHRLRLLHGSVAVDEDDLVVVGLGGRLPDDGKFYHFLMMFGCCSKSF